MICSSLQSLKGGYERPHLLGSLLFLIVRVLFFGLLLAVVLLYSSCLHGSLCSWCLGRLLYTVMSTISMSEDVYCLISCHMNKPLFDAWLRGVPCGGAEVLLRWLGNSLGRRHACHPSGRTLCLVKDVPRRHHSPPRCCHLPQSQIQPLQALEPSWEQISWERLSWELAPRHCFLPPSSLPQPWQLAQPVQFRQGVKAHMDSSDIIVVQDAMQDTGA